MAMNTQLAFEYLNQTKRFDRDIAFEYSRRGAEEGIVLLENKNRTLPFNKNTKAAFFGRMQKHYLPLGTGSGGRVVAIENTNVFDSLKSCSIAFWGYRIEYPHL